MILWGSTIDPAKAQEYQVLQDEADAALPPHESPLPSPTTALATKTKTHGKPTAHLPSNHSSAPGENTNATFPGQQEGAAVPSGTSSPTADEGWFSDMSNLVKNQGWFFGAIGAVAIFGLAAGLYFWRRRVRRLRDYTTLSAEDSVPMSGVRSGRVGTGPRTKELYDAFGEVSEDEDDDDADEQTRLRPGFQDEPRGAVVRPPQYRDEPEAGSSHSRRAGSES